MGWDGVYLFKQRIQIFIFQGVMEASELTVGIIMATLSTPANKALSQMVINYLGSEDIEAINAELEKTEVQNSFTQLIRTHFFLNSYLNKLDRSFYYSFYEDQHFRAIEATHTTLLAHNYSNCFLQFPAQYRKCFHFIASLFPEQVNPYALIQQLQRMITDTDIPMPKLKRQNQGIFCRTVFQNYLIYLKFRNQCFSDCEEAFENLCAYFQANDQIYLQKLFMKSRKDKVLSKKIRFVRFTPYEITFQNFHSHLVEHNSLHNFLVVIFVLTDVWLTSIKCYISSLEDPFHRYIELMTRYSIYLQENLSFVFEQYSQLYQEVLGGGKPRFRFWRPAMTKWMVKFEQYHSECSSVYYYCLTKLRTKSALQFLTRKQQQQPDIYMNRSAKNKIAQREYEVDVNETLLPNKVSNGVEDFFQQNTELYQTVLIQYTEYMVDLSINEETVHWCGHSEQILSEPYLSFEKYVLAENKMYLSYLRDLVPDLQTRHTFQKAFFEQDLQFLQSIEFKPVTLKKLVQFFNIELSDSPFLSEYFQGISYEFTPNDQTLKYFNEKAMIKYEIPKQQMYFYSITPLVSADQLLTKSITTNCSQGIESQQEQSICEMEYFSRSSSVEDYGNDRGNDLSERKLMDIIENTDSQNGLRRNNSSMRRSQETQPMLSKPPKKASLALISKYSQNSAKSAKKQPNPYFREEKSIQPIKITTKQQTKEQEKSILLSFDPLLDCT